MIIPPTGGAFGRLRLALIEALFFSEPLRNLDLNALIVTLYPFAGDLDLRQRKPFGFFAVAVIADENGSISLVMNHQRQRDLIPATHFRFQGIAAALGAGAGAVAC